MNVAILSSSSDKIDNYYLSIARSISNYLADYGCNLVFGACSTSMMGICYDEFKRKTRKIYSLTTKKYESDLENLDSTFSLVCDTTFDLKKSMYELADCVVVLPGGTGTDSEFLSFIEEARSNDNKKDIILYNEGGYFNSLLDIFKQKIDNGFNNESLFDYFKVCNNRFELEDAIMNINLNERMKKYEK